MGKRRVTQSASFVPLEGLILLNASSASRGWPLKAVRSTSGAGVAACKQCEGEKGERPQGSLVGGAPHAAREKPEEESQKPEATIIGER